jgi:hypothetical protein
MACGYPTAFNGAAGLQAQASLGIDCQSFTTTPSMPNEMRLLLQNCRAVYNEPFVRAGKNPTKINKTVGEAFNLEPFLEHER